MILFLAQQIVRGHTMEQSRRSWATYQKPLRFVSRELARSLLTCCDDMLSASSHLFPVARFAEMVLPCWPLFQAFRQIQRFDTFLSAAGERRRRRGCVGAVRKSRLFCIVPFYEPDTIFCGEPAIFVRYFVVERVCKKVYFLEQNGKIRDFSR
jgi:hypothetical protein